VAGIDANTKLMLHFNEGPSGITTGFADSSPQNHSVTAVATTHADLTTKYFGTGSIKLDGNSDYLQIADSADWDICASGASSSWTIDFWVKHTDHAGREDYIAQYANATHYWSLFRHDAVKISFNSISGGAMVIDCNANVDITDTNWHHLALIKKTDEYGIYLDGIQIAYTQDSSINNLVGNLVIGQMGDSSAWLDGHLDEIRIQKSNIFGADPATTASALDDTITVPTTEYSFSETYTPAGLEAPLALLPEHDLDVDKVYAPANLETSMGLTPSYSNLYHDAGDIEYTTGANSTFLDLQSGFARPYWHVGITVSGASTTYSGTLGHAYKADNDIISMGTIDRERPIAISGLSRMYAGNLTMTLNNASGKYSPRATASIFTDSAGSAMDYMHSKINIWAGFKQESGTAIVIQRGSFLLTQIRVDSHDRKAYIGGEDAARIPLQSFVGLPEESGTATTWTPPSGKASRAIMTELASAIGMTGDQYLFTGAYDFPDYALQSASVGNALAELAHANDGYMFTNGEGKLVCRINAPSFPEGDAATPIDLTNSGNIGKLKYSIDIKNLVNKVQVNYTSGLDSSRTNEDATVTKGRTQIINNKVIDQASIANALSTKLLGEYKQYRDFIEVDNVWLPSIDVGDTVKVYDGNTYQTGIAYTTYRIREDIIGLKTKIYATLDARDVGKWGFCSESGVDNSGTVFAESWHSGFAFACNVNTGFDDDGNNNDAINTAYTSSGAGYTGIEVPFKAY